eukprot:2513668-Ditylum_brightwellii.AAC.1
MESAKDTGEKQKAEEKTEQTAKQRKNEVNLNTQREETNLEIKEKIRERREQALEAEQGFQTEVTLSGQCNANAL